MHALPEDSRHFFIAHASEALRLTRAVFPSVVVVGGSSNQAVVDSCKELRATEACRHSVIVAASERPEDLRFLIDAGADDVFLESLGNESLRGRLLVAQRTAAGIAARHKVENVYEEFFRSSSPLFCIADFNGYFKTINRAWTRVLGWSTAELLSTSWLDFVHPDDRQSSVATWQRLRVGQPVVDSAHRCRCKDGNYRLLESQSVPLVERGVFYAVVRDITEASATTAALRELTEGLATTLASIGDGVIATDLTGAIIRMNPAAEQLTGWAFADAKGRPLPEVLSITNQDTGAQVDNPIDRVLSEGVTVALARRTVLRRPDGTDLPIADSCAPIKSGNGEVHGAVLVFRDLTAQRSAESTQAKYLKHLVFTDRMASVGTLAAGVAHEINNPLTYMSANLDMAIAEVHGLAGAAPSARLKDLEEMLIEARRGVSRVTKIVRGLKTFSRVGEERKGVVDIVAVLELSISMAFNEIQHRGRLVRDYGAIPLVEADEARLGQVFINLLVNAAQALQESRMAANEIRVATSTDAAGRAVVEVCDTGPGIPAALLARIFDPFFTTKPVGVGTGLGLGICHTIVTDLGGEISVRSDMGRGTVFRVALPAAPTGASLTPAPATEAETMTRAAARVLIVDDDPAVGRALGRILQGHNVTVVASAQAALSLLAAGQDFDVILSDLMMPGMSGMELYEELARRHPELAARVVFLTGGAFTPAANSFLDRVGNARMEKPFDPVEMRNLIGKFAK
ncbi:MAG TPA: PAS domain S-box protein [Polyangiales bacterium]